MEKRISRFMSALVAVILVSNYFFTFTITVSAAETITDAPAPITEEVPVVEEGLSVEVEVGEEPVAPVIDEQTSDSVEGSEPEVETQQPKARTALAEVIPAEDTTYPTVSFVDNVAQGPVQTETVQVSVTDDNLDTVFYSFGTDGTCDTSETYSNPYISGQILTFTSESDNGNFICVRATDTASHTVWVSSLYSINIDRTLPTITFTDDVSIGPVQLENVAVEIFDVNFDTYSFVYTTSATCNASTSFSGAFGPGDFSSAISTETYNNHYICFRATDKAGNNSYQRSANPLDIDAFAPAINFADNVEHGPVGVDYVQIGVVDSHLQSFAYAFSNDNTCDASDSYTNTFINNGVIEFNDDSHNGEYICVRATDEVGNTTYRASQYALNIDADFPVIVIVDDVEEGPVKQDLVDLHIIEDNLAELKYYASNDDVCDAGDTYIGEYTEEDTIVINTPTHNGKYLCFWAVDDIGNTTTKVSTHPLNIDNIPPTIIKVDNLEGRPMKEDRIVLETDDPSVDVIQYGYSTTAGCFDADYAYEVLPGDEFYITNPDENGLYLCFRATDGAGNTGYEQSNVAINIDNTLPEVTFTNDVSGEPVIGETIEVVANVGDLGDLAYGFSPDPICDENDSYDNPIESGEPEVIDDVDGNGHYVCVMASDGAGNPTYASSANPLNLTPLYPGYEIVYLYAGSPEGIVDSFVANAYFVEDPSGSDAQQYGFSPDDICDENDTFNDVNGSPLWEAWGWGDYTFTLNEETYNGQYLCLKAVDGSGTTQYLIGPSYSGEIQPIRVDRFDPQIQIIEDVDSGLSNTKTITVIAGDTHLHKIEYGIATSIDCSDADYVFPDSSTSGFSHSEAIYRPWTVIEVTDELEISGDFNGQYICVRAIDAYGRTTTVASSQITNLDSIAPIITVTDDVSNIPTQNDEITFTVSENSSLQHVAYGFSSENCTDLLTEDYNFLTIASEYNFTIDVEEYNGSYLCIFALDEAGNLEIFRSEEVITVDLTPPDLDYLDDMLGQPLNDNQLVLQFGGANISIFAYGFSATPTCNENNDFIQTFTNPDGEILIDIDGDTYAGQYICFMATDLAGNTTYVGSEEPIINPGSLEVEPNPTPEDPEIEENPENDDEGSVLGSTTDGTNSGSVLGASTGTLARTGMDLQQFILSGVFLNIALLSVLIATNKKLGLEEERRN